MDETEKKVQAYTTYVMSNSSSDWESFMDSPFAKMKAITMGLSEDDLNKVIEIISQKYEKKE